MLQIDIFLKRKKKERLEICTQTKEQTSGRISLKQKFCL